MSTQNCSNCYNGCTEITSDKCVKYTGVDVPILGIKNGDSLSYVEQALITFLGSTLDGTGIQPVVPPSDICPEVQANLDDCSPLSLNNYLTGIIKTICDLQTEIDNLQSGGSSTPYSVGCVSGVSDNTSTQDVLQQTIIKLCDVEQSLNTFITDVTTNYVQIVDIDTYIENYLNNNPQQQLISNRMVPFAVVAYYGSLNPFDVSGAGLGTWDRIFLCNGQNGTPDLRGRAVIGATNMGGGQMNPAVDPGISGNPSYDVGVSTGSNQVNLNASQIPSHTHVATATSTISPNPHDHYMISMSSDGESNPPSTNSFIQQAKSTGGNLGYALRGTDNSDVMVGLTTEASLSCSTDVVNAATGGSLSHDNFQPGFALHYIIYIP